MSALFDSDFNLGGFFSLGSAYSVYSKPRSNSVDSFDNDCSPHNAVRYLHPPVQQTNKEGQQPRHSKDTENIECEAGNGEGTVYHTTSADSEDIDRGWAWAVLVASFLCNCINIGINNSVGVYNAEFLIQFPDETRSYVSLAGSLQNSVCGLTGLVSGIIANKYSCRTSILLGAIISSLGFIGTAFATNVPEIILTFGFVVGFGTGLVYTATSVCVGQYFHKRRPMALGIATAGMALGQFMCPPLFQFLIDTYSWRGSAFIIAGLCLNNCVFGTIMRPLRETHRDTDEAACPENERRAQIAKANEASINDAKGRLNVPVHIDNDISLDTTATPNGIHRNSNDSVPGSHTSIHRFRQENSHRMAGRDNILKTEPRHRSLGVSSFLSVSIGAFGSMTSNISQHFVSNNQLSEAVERNKPSCMDYVKSILDIHPLKNPEFICFGISVLFWAAQVLTCGLHLIAYTLQHGTTPIQGAILLSVFGAGNFFSRLLAGAATNDKAHVDQVTLGAGVMGITALLLFCFPALVHSYWSQVLFAALYGVYSTILIPLLAPMTVETVGLSSLGAGFGYLMVMSGTGCAIGPPLAGFIYDHTKDYSYSFYFAGALSMGSSIMLLAIPILKSRRLKTESDVTSA